MKTFMTLRDALLIFWRTITSIGCQAQTSVITQFAEHNFQSSDNQKWLRNLFEQREKGELTTEQCMQIQHETLIMEQTGIEETTTDLTERCTLSVLSKMLFNYDGKFHTPDELLSVQYDDETIKQFAYCYYLLSASHHSDTFLNVSFGLMLDLQMRSKDSGVCYNSDEKTLFELHSVELVRGSIENSQYCTSYCAVSTDKESHVEECKTRGATWLLLTFVDTNSVKRQLHFDVASSAYAKPKFYNKKHPLPCNAGFLPKVDAKTRLDFEKRGWPMAPIPIVSSSSTNTPIYSINQFDCVLPVLHHYTSVNKIRKNFKELTDECRDVAYLWHSLQHAIQTNQKDTAKQILFLLFQITNLQQANLIAATFIRYVDANTESIMLQIFFDNLRNYGLILEKLSGVIV